MLHHPIIGTMKSFGILLIFCVLSVKSNLIAPNESSLSLRLIDVETKISPIPVLFLKKKSYIVIEGLGWLKEDKVTKKIDNSFVHKTNDDSRLIYSTFINERQVANGTVELSDVWNKNNTKGISSSIDVGIIEVENPGLNSIRVVLYSVLNGDIIESSATLNVRSYRQWTACIPIFLAFGLFLVFNVHMITSLFFAMFIGSWIIEGSMINGFRAVLDTYLLQAATDSAHVSILLFIVGVSTLMTMVRRSGGTTAVMKSLRHHSSKTRVAQVVIFSMGVVIFFDPYVSIMVVGEVLGSIIKGFPLSSEKVSFLIDTTAAPVASIFPKSTWLIFAGDLIQREIDKITELGIEEISFPSGYSLVLSSISYQFYPCLILGLAILQILTGREMGPILDAENQARFSYNTSDQDDEVRMTVRKRSWNWYIPVVFLNIFLWFAFNQAGLDYTGKSQDPAFLATTWLISVGATIILTQIIFILQKRNGRLPFLDYYIDRKENNRIAYLTDTFPSASGSASIPYNPSSKSEDTDGYLKTAHNDHRKILKMNTGEDTNDSEGNNYLGCLKDAPLLNFQDGIACLVHGTATAVPITLSLVFAWATGSVYIALGVDRVIISWILNDSLSTEILPVAVFLAAFLLSLIIGSSWCSISILIPGTMLPLVDSLGGDSKVLVLTLASILSGAAAGDHIGPFSETTILSAIISGSEVRQHCLTQAPYALFVFVLSLLVGTLPVSYDGYPDYVGYIIGVAVLIVFVIFVCRQVERYQSSIPGQIQDQPITKSLHPMMAGEIGNTIEESSDMSSKLEIDTSDGILVGKENKPQQPTVEEVCILHSSTQQGTEVVETSNGMPSIQIQNKTNNLRSFKNKLQKINNTGGDPVLGLVEDGLLPENFRSELQKPPLGERPPSSNYKKDPANENKKRLIEATIKKAEQDGNMFSDSLRTFLRTAEQKLGKILDNNESLEISGSGSADSSGDDSLDNLMMDIAAKGWRTSINDLLGDDAETLTSAGEDYTTDGASTLLESDDSATATSSSLGGNGQSTYFTNNGDVTSCASTATGRSEYSTGTSRLLNPLEFNKTRQTLQHGWDDNEELSSRVDDIFSATDYTKASF